MMPYRSFHAAMRERFGCKVYKLALDAGFTCPNRDGTLGTRGCLFCSQAGGGEFAASGADIAAQLEVAKRRVARKNPGGKYMAYFQAFTNTYAPPERLAALYAAATAPDDIVALDVATRPDCLGPEVLEVLAGVAKPLIVELGLQTIHAPTARTIRRGYDLPAYDEAVGKLHAIGAEVVAHEILGLPGETAEMMVETARYIGQSADGIKLHLLHILDDADLSAAYRAGAVRVLEEEEYFALVAACLRVLPPGCTVHRLTGDGAKSHLLAPLWSADKKHVLNSLRAYLIQNNVHQGSAL